ncbi:MAG: hypothetical protein HY819_23940 [Acidobacteria bacterium]|nr:hypothetical protein [Acidobacteriota bacterium]
MADIKINGSGLNNLQQINQDNNQLDKLNRSGNFQGQTVNTISPPSESPLTDGTQNRAFNASLAKPPLESPFSNTESENIGKGYRLSEASSATSASPSSEVLFDFATGKNKSGAISKYLEQDPAASKAVDTVRRASLEIGSPDNSPKLDNASQSRLGELARKIFIT